jgi:hypothetical protein
VTTVHLRAAVRPLAGLCRAVDWPLTGRHITTAITRSSHETTHFDTGDIHQHHDLRRQLAHGSAVHSVGCTELGGLWWI